MPITYEDLRREWDEKERRNSEDFRLRLLDYEGSLLPRERVYCNLALLRTLDDNKNRYWARKYKPKRKTRFK